MLNNKWSHFPGRCILAPLAELAALRNIQIYLVGGTVRDLLLGKETEDLDFALSAYVFSFAREFADMAQASFVPLDEEHETVRVVLREGYYMDFSRIRGADILEDLRARDFTINAMAVALSQIADINSEAVERAARSLNEIELIDPCNGLDDLNSGLIRLASAQSIKDDPVRMLRAYRFAATLGYKIHNTALNAIRDSLDLLESVASERIRDELFKILSVSNSIPYLKGMDDVGLLEKVFPEIIGMKGMEQNKYHHLDVWGHSMLTLEFLEHDPFPGSLMEYLPEVESYLENEPVKGRPRKALLKLAALLHDIGKPAMRTIDRNGRIRFFDHNLEGAEIAGDIGTRLRLATRETLFLKKSIEDHMRPLGLIVFLRKDKRTNVRERAIRRFLHRTGSEWLAILLLSFADVRATQGPLRKDDDLAQLDRLIRQIANVYFQQVSSPMTRLITGRDLMEEFGLSASPTIGRLLEQVRHAQIDGKVRTREDAINMVRDILAEE